MNQLQNKFQVRKNADYINVLKVHMPKAKDMVSRTSQINNEPARKINMRVIYYNKAMAIAVIYVICAHLFL